jgi:hypothetical protein
LLLRSNVSEAVHGHRNCVDPLKFNEDTNRGLLVGFRHQAAGRSEP